MTWGISIKISGKTAYYNIKTLKKAVSLSLSVSPKIAGGRGGRVNMYQVVKNNYFVDCLTTLNNVILTLYKCLLKNPNWIA